MPIQQVERRGVRPTPLETGIKPLESLIRPSVIFPERSALLALPISQGGLVEYACYKMRRRTKISEDQPTQEKRFQGSISFSVPKGHKERIRRGSSRSRCSRCGEKDNSSHHQCGAANGTLRPQLFRQAFHIRKLPSKTSGF